MLAQHAAYADALRALGLEIEVLDPLPGFPDAYFVEDVAVVVPELAVVARLEYPATLDGGDVLIAGRTVFIGLSARTNETGAEQLAGLLEPHGYRSQTVPVAAGLHL